MKSHMTQIGATVAGESTGRVVMFHLHIKWIHVLNRPPESLTPVARKALS